MRSLLGVLSTERKARAARKAIARQEREAAELAKGVSVRVVPADLSGASPRVPRFVPHVLRAFTLFLFACSALSVLNRNASEVFGFLVAGLVFLGLAKVAALLAEPPSSLRGNVVAFMLDNGLVKDAGSGMVDSATLSLRSAPFDGLSALRVEVDYAGGRWRNAAVGLDESLQAWFALPLVSKEPGLTSCVYWLARPAERLAFDPREKSRLGSWREIGLARNLSIDVTKMPHCLVCGGTGGGKSTFLLCLMAYILRLGSSSDARRPELFVCDPKNAELSQLSRALPSGHVAVTPGQIAGLLRHCVEDMEGRYQAMHEAGHIGGGFDEAGFVPSFVVFDEFSAFKAAAASDKKTLDEVMKALVQLILKGRAAGVFVVVCTQQPRADTIPTDLRDQLSVRVSLGNLSGEGYRMCYGEAASGFEFRSVSEPGTGYILLPGWNAPRQFSSWYVDKGVNLVDVVSSLVASSDGVDDVGTDSDKG